MRTRGRRLANAVVPSLRAQRAAERARADEHHALARRVRDVTGGVVATGPFAGLVLAETISWVSLNAYLIGRYECEVHPWLERAISGQPEVVIDIGAAEGYYAIGLARRLPRAKVFAFDIDARARAACRENALRNGVSARVAVDAECDHAALNRLAGDVTLIVIDCEGCEHSLLDPDAVPRLRDSLLLVELHDFIVHGITETVLARFALTHDIEIVASRESSADVQPDELAALTRAQFEAAVDEGRPTLPHPMRWALMMPKPLR